MRYTQKRLIITHDKAIDAIWEKYTLRELAKLVGVHYTHLSRIRSGEFAASEKLYLKIKKLV